MESFIYCLFDKVACTYLPIFESVNDASAIRDFKAGFAKNPEQMADFDLLCLVKMTKQLTAGSASLTLQIVEDEYREVKIDG